MCGGCNYMQQSYISKYLWYAVLMSDYPDQFVEGEERVASDLRGNILPLSTEGQ